MCLVSLNLSLGFSASTIPLSNSRRISHTSGGVFKFLKRIPWGQSKICRTYFSSLSSTTLCFMSNESNAAFTMMWYPFAFMSLIFKRLASCSPSSFPLSKNIFFSVSIAS
mgnify:CR=1 FL=1